MHLEIEAAVNFLMKILSLKKTLAPDQLVLLGKNLLGLLRHRYKGHWYPDSPARGQAYRCVRINPWQYVDESLLQACTQCDIDYSRIGLPKEITLWIDPFEVCGRFGEHTDFFTIAIFKHDVVREPAQYYPQPETSDYSSEDPSSESVSETSDDEISEEKSTIAKKICTLPPNCKSPDEAIECHSTSNAGTPFNELMEIETEHMSLSMDGSVAKEDKQETLN
ncbi:maternal B9.10 protein-like [Pseudophryne corroboree]|uniref:maternal B9.10 protein-like n=1 Tax=Pseudophryne corroboree TaxID=495146 RepID=UPI00308166F5